MPPAPPTWPGLIGQWLPERLGAVHRREPQRRITNIATEAVARAHADGYTLLVVTASNAINATLYDKLNFDFLRDIAPVAGLIRYPLVMQVNPSFPAKTVPEFISYAKANPGKISYGSGGHGTSIHVASELFKMMTGINMIHVPYRGGAPAMTDLMGGQVQVVLNPLRIDGVHQGRQAAPAGGDDRDALAGAAGDPGGGEFVPGYEASAVQGIGAPKPPAEIVERLNKEINAGLADPKLNARFTELGGTVFPGSAADFGAFMADETEKWAKVIRFSGAKAE